MVFQYEIINKAWLGIHHHARSLKKVYKKLVVTENQDANVEGLKYATIVDCIQEDNIPYFGNCKRMPDNADERKKFIEIYEKKSPADSPERSRGTCRYLMKLESEWENYIIDGEYQTFGDDRQGKKSGITMTSMLFCKHGGFIYPVFSGQNNEWVLDESDSEAVKEYMWNFFIEAGFSEIAVAGILGNVYAESTFDPSKIYHNKYYGLFQLGGGREEGLFKKGEEWARKMGLPEKEGWKSVQVQCEYTLEEYNNGSDGWITHYIKREDGSVLEGSKENFQNAQNTYDAVLAFGISYERCPDGEPEEIDGNNVYPKLQMQKDRLEIAEKIYDKFGSK